MKRKFLSITLSLALIFTSLLVSNNIGKSLAAEEDDWNYISGYDDDGLPMFPYVDFGPFIRGIGTHDEPYIISTAAQLAALSVLSNNVDELDNPELGEFYYLCDRYENLRGGEDFNGSYFVVDRDIDLSEYRWTPIGINHSFKGNIDFQGHTVDGIRMMVKDTDDQDTKLLGLFAKSEGSISNLTIGGRGSFHCVTNDACFGSVVALNKGSVLNCRNNFNAEVNAESSAIAGGIVGRNTGEGNIYRCINTGKISAASLKYESVGGIVGFIREDSRIAYCDNRADIFASKLNGYDSPDSIYVGGIVGSQLSKFSEISNCINSGNVDYLDAKALYCGKIVGFGFTDHIENCYYLLESESDFIAGVGAISGKDIGSSTAAVDQDRLNEIRQQLNIPA